MEGRVFRKAMRRFAGTVSVVATGVVGQRAGITATSLCSLSDDPPSLVVCVSRNAMAHERIRRAGCFSVNVLASDQAEIAECFAGRTGLRGEDRFAVGRWKRVAAGAPLLGGAALAFICKLLWERDCETHSIFCGLVEDIMIADERSPLVYFDGRFRAVCPTHMDQVTAA